MSAPKQAEHDAPLTLADCIVRAARGHERHDGGIAFSGALFVRDCPAGSFSCAGDGGCYTWHVRPEQVALFSQFEALAKRLHPEVKFEHADHLAGSLWDAAIMRAAGVQS